MADMQHAKCTCPACWLGTAKRPPCTVHELDPLPPGHARRRDGTVVEVARTIGIRRGVERDSEGMGAARSWYPVIAR